MSASRISGDILASGKNVKRNVSWVRNPAWLTLPTITDSDHKFAGLFAVYEDSNFVALSAAGDYTVNWGDGTSENISSGVQAERNIAYSNASATSDIGIADAIACTFTDAGDTIGLVGHGWENNQKVAFATITSTTGISTYTTYFIVNKTNDTFQVSATVGGSPITLTTNGSGSVYIPKYRQVIITVVPNGGNLTAINLQKKHSQSGLSTHSYSWLDIAIAGSNITSLTVSSQSIIMNIDSLEQFSLYTNSITNLSYALYNCSALTSIPVFNSSNVTNFSNTFQNCDSLSLLPIFNTSNGTNFVSTFQQCKNLTSIPLLNTSTGTDFSGMFWNCYSLQEVPLLNTSNGKSFNSMFRQCYSITSIPKLNTVNGTDFSYMFMSCYSLREVPLLNTSSGTDFSSLFYECTSLRSIPTLDVRNGLNFYAMFGYSPSLTTVPLLNSVKGTNFSSLFEACVSLINAPMINMTAAKDISYMFSSCISLVAIPVFNVTNVTSFTGMFSNCTALSSARLENTKYNITYSGKLSATALNDIYTGLATVTGKTITVTGNWGTASDDPTIATAKGWTVTG